MTPMESEADSYKELVKQFTSPPASPASDSTNEVAIESRTYQLPSRYNPDQFREIVKSGLHHARQLRSVAELFARDVLNLRMFLDPHNLLDKKLYRLPVYKEVITTWRETLGIDPKKADSYTTNYLPRFRAELPAAHPWHAPPPALSTPKKQLSVTNSDKGMAVDLIRTSVDVLSRRWDLDEALRNMSPSEFRTEVGALIDTLYKAIQYTHRVEGEDDRVDELTDLLIPDLPSE